MSSIISSLSQRPSYQWDAAPGHHHHACSSRRFSAAVMGPTTNDSQGMLLNVPQQRERNYSLPSSVLSEELYRMRMFSVQGNN